MSVVTDAAAMGVGTALDNAGGATITALTKLVKTVASLPLTSWLKLGIGVGIAVFTGYTLIKRHKMQKKAMKEAEQPTVFGNGILNPADMAMRENFAGNPTIFDKLDEDAKMIARDADILEGRRPAKKHKSHKKNHQQTTQHVERPVREKTYSSKVLRMCREKIEDILFPDEECEPFGPEDWDKVLPRTPVDVEPTERAKVDAAAERLGLYIENADDDIPDDIRRKYTGILF